MFYIPSFYLLNVIKRTVRRNKATIVDLWLRTRPMFVLGKSCPGIYLPRDWHTLEANHKYIIGVAIVWINRRNNDGNSLHETTSKYNSDKKYKYNYHDYRD